MDDASRSPMKTWAKTGYSITTDLPWGDQRDTEHVTQAPLPVLPFLELVRSQEWGKEQEKGSSHQLFVPRLVGGGPSSDVVDYVDDEEGDQEKGTDAPPHDLPVPVGTMTQHVFNIFFKPIRSR